MIAKLITLLNPSYWLMLEKYDKNVDEWLLNAMKHYQIILKYADSRKHVYEIIIDGKILWVANYPYSAFTYRYLETDMFGACLTNDCANSGRPSRATIYKFNKILTKWLKENKMERA